MPTKTVADKVLDRAAALEYRDAVEVVLRRGRHATKPRPLRPARDVRDV